MTNGPPIKNIGTAMYVTPDEVPNPEVFAARPFESFGFWVLVIAFVLFLASSLVLALKARAPGAWLVVLGLLIALMYFVFRNTVADWAELRYGPWADAVAQIAYGVGALFVALGYARMAFHVVRHSLGP